MAVSQTPNAVVESSNATGYVTAWKTISRWTEEGRSWSGHERHCCFLNTGRERFANVSTVSGLDFADDGRGIAVVDWDHDGAQDLWVSSRTAPQIRFFHNRAGASGHFVAVKLVGQTCNRDAVGARVDVQTNDREPVQIKTLRAGEGYLSQSSKWLHFGLGEVTSIDEVRVRWPDGTLQTLSDLSVDRFYVITQGNEAVAEWQRPDAESHISPGPPRPPQPTGAIEHLLASPYPLPPLVYEAQNGKRLSLATASRRPRLVLLWASWCQPCLVEFKELASARDQLRAANVDLLALSVDGLGEDSSDPDRARDYLERIEFPFAYGQASSDLLDALQAINDDLFKAKRPLPIPSGFLIDAEGRLAAIYKGAVDIARIRADLARLDLDRNDRMAASLSRPGRWEFPPRGIRTPMYLENARQLAEQEKWSAAAAEFRLTLEDGPRNPVVHYHLARVLLKQRQVEETIHHFRQAVEIHPDYAAAHFGLADLLLQRRQFATATTHYQHAVRADPGMADGHAKLGVLFAMKRDLAQAERHFRQAVHIEPTNADYQSNLGKSLLDQRKFRDAVKHFRLSRTAEKSPVSAALNLSWILSTCDDAALRDGGEAVRLEQECVRRTGGRNAVAYDRLAAAHAESGDFDEAIAAAKKAAMLARRQNNPRMATEIEARLGLYQENRPFRVKTPKR